MNNRGQSLIEVVFAIGIILFVISGVVSLLLSSFGSRTKSYDRLKAVELSQIVIESIINQEVTDPINFWNLQSAYWVANLGTTQTNSLYPSYDFSIGVIPRNDIGCSNNLPLMNCVDVVVNVGWSGSQTNESFNRFFSKK